jgi:hypothetical protein
VNPLHHLRRNETSVPAWSKRPKTALRKRVLRNFFKQLRLVETGNIEHRREKNFWYFAIWPRGLKEFPKALCLQIPSRLFCMLRFIRAPAQ